MAPNPSLLFFTCATGYYSNFVIPYVYFAALHNPGAKFEFIVNDADALRAKHAGALAWLETHLDAVVVLRDRPATKAKMENSLRFIVEPLTKADLVYIGDVDIMILEPVREKHRKVFDAGLPYSNVVRDGTKRLSGLHFTRYDTYYPLPEIDDLVANTVNDEELLYKIVERKGALFDQASNVRNLVGRPIHGIHMSMNRFPFSAHAERVSWGMRYQDAKNMETILQSAQFQEFNKVMHKGPAHIVLNLTFLCRGICSYGEEFFAENVRP